MPSISWNNKELKEQQAGTSGINTGIDAGTVSQGYQHGSLTRGLVAYYPMEKGQGQVLHDGALNNHGQIQGATWTTDAAIGGQALDFDGNDDYLRLNQLDPYIKAPVTVSLWVKWNSFENREYRVFDHGGGRFNISHEDDGSNGVEFSIYDGSRTVITSGFSQTGSWNHYCATFDGSTMRFFLDGNLQGTASSSSSIDESTQGTVLASKSGSAGDGTTNVNAQISEVRIYKRILSQPEIQALYNLTQHSGTQITGSDVPNQQNNGIARYKLNGNVDDSWNNNHGTDETSAGYTDNGVYGKAKVFDKSNNDYVDFPTSGPTGSITLSAWAKLHSFGSTDNRIIGNHKAPSGEHTFLDMRDDETSIRFFIDDGSSTLAPETKTGFAETGKWYHIVGTHDGNSKARLYVNGELKNSVKDTNFSGYTNPDANFRAGTRTNSSTEAQFDGAIDDIRIYNTALSPVQVEQLYKLGSHKINRGDTLT